MADLVLNRPEKLIVVVLYKTQISVAETLLSLTRSSSKLYPVDKIFIWDNSPKAQATDAIARFAGSVPCQVEYYHAVENTSLARVYNKVVAANELFDTVFFFDQDSNFDGNYFTCQEEAANLNPQINLFVPIIFNGDQVVSPGHFYYFKGNYWRGPHYGIVTSQKTVAIMSGMAIRHKYLSTFGGFDESLNLYGIDTNFMLRYARDNRFFYVLNVKFGHDLSDFKPETQEVKKFRFEDFKRASLINAALFSFPIPLITKAYLSYRSFLEKFRR